MKWSLLRLQVAPYKKIRKVVFVDQIPRSPSGKILRRQLRAWNAPQQLEIPSRLWSPIISISNHSLYCHCIVYDHQNKVGFFFLFSFFVWMYVNPQIGWKWDLCHWWWTNLKDDYNFDMVKCCWRSLEYKRESWNLDSLHWFISCFRVRIASDQGLTKLSLNIMGNYVTIYEVAIQDIAVNPKQYHKKIRRKCIYLG